MPNILCLNISSAIGGAERSLLALLENLNKDLYKPIVCIPDKGPFYDVLKKTGIEVICIPIGVLNTNFLNPFPYINTVKILVSLIKKYRIDIIHSNSEGTSQCAVIAGKLSRKPVICHVRNFFPKRAFIRDLIGWNNILIAISGAIAEELTFFQKGNKHVRIVHNGVDLNCFTNDDNSRIAIRREMGFSDDNFVLGVMGSRIAHFKGQHIAIKALKNLIDKGHKEVRLLITGSTAIDRSEGYLQDLKKTITEMNLNGRVRFTGFVDDITSIYNAIDLLVLPSQKEPFGRVLIEAMAMGKPVIASRSGGAVEVVEDGVSGILFTTDDCEELKNAILKIINNKDFACKIGNNGKERVSKLFSIEKHVKKIQDIYEELVMKNRNGIRKWG